MSLVPMRFVNPSLQGGLGGTAVGVVTGFITPTMFGSPFNGGTIANGTNVNTDDILAPGYNSFMIVVVTAGAALTVSLHLLDPILATQYFSDTVGTAAIGTTRLLIYASAGTRSGDPPIRWRLNFSNVAAVPATGVTLSLWSVNR